MEDGGVAEVAKCLETRAARFVTEAIERSIREAAEYDKDWGGLEEEREREEEEEEGEEGGACLVGGASVADVRRGAGEQRVRARVGQAVGSSRRVNGAVVRIPWTRMLVPASIEGGNRLRDAETLPIGSIGRWKLGEANSGSLP